MADPPGPARRDWLLVAIVVVVATVEAFARDQLVWAGASLAVAVGLACLLPWRRVRPWFLAATAFGALAWAIPADSLGHTHFLSIPQPSTTVPEIVRRLFT